MKKPSLSSVRRRWFSVALLAVVVPVSLLAAFRLAGIIPEPLEPENIKLEVISWNMSRPFYNIIINQTLENLHVDSNASISLGVHIEKYYKKDPDFPAYYNDLIKLRVSVKSNLTDGFVHSFVINFSRIDDTAFVDILEDPISWRLYNAKIQEVHDLRTSQCAAYIKASSIQQPKQCSLSIVTYWIFTDENTSDHWITINLETIYYDGSAHKKVIIPIMVGVVIS